MKRYTGIVAAIGVFLWIWLMIVLFSGDETLTVFTNNDGYVRAKMTIDDVISGRPLVLPQDHPLIIKYIKDNGYLLPPSTEEYKLKEPEIDPSRGQSEFILKKLLNNMTNGFFVECGALDGETRSNTLFMERHLGWKGLLIEGDPLNYKLLQWKHRKVWSSRACLAVKPHPHKVEYMQSFNVGKIKGDVDEGAPIASKKTAIVQCFPLFSLLTAMNVTTVDYFSLDVEGHELQVLRTIPFKKVFIKTLSVEYIHTHEGKDELINFMKDQDYNVAGEVHYPGMLANDIMFVHKSLGI